MAKISKEQLKKRKAELGKQAREELAKSEVMRFRLAPTSILQLCELAEQKRQHVGTMVREWVLERAEAEANLGYKAGAISGMCKEPSGAAYYSDFDLNAILQRLQSLEKEVERLARRK